MSEHTAAGTSGPTHTSKSYLNYSADGKNLSLASNGADNFRGIWWGFGKPAAARWPVGATESSMIGQAVTGVIVAPPRPSRGGGHGNRYSTNTIPKNKQWLDDGRHPIGRGSAL
jgi:hypothetical protein